MRTASVIAKTAVVCMSLTRRHFDKHLSGIKVKSNLSLLALVMSSHAYYVYMLTQCELCKHVNFDGDTPVVLQFLHDQCPDRRTFAFRSCALG